MHRRRACSEVERPPNYSYQRAIITYRGNPETGKDQSMVKGTGKGWLRRKKAAALFCWRNMEGMERSFVIGSAALDEKRSTSGQSPRSLSPSSFTE